MGISVIWFVFSVITMYFQTTDQVEFTFELMDKAKECFYEDIQQNTTVNLDYQVVTGGSYDVDVTVEDPAQNFIYRQMKSQLNSYTFNSLIEGTYKICFSNEFSTFSHKLVYIYLQVGEEPVLPGVNNHTTVMTQMELSIQEIHESLKSVLDHQTYHRLREAQGRKRAEDLNDRVLLWSLIETVAILFASIGQVFMLKHLFSERKHIPYNRL
uniref:GOLD domain-containing protein n=1 Tax=Cuerna arida TaxID=1464854 RepID=A0A1B6F8B8_9HEMI